MAAEAGAGLRGPGFRGVCGAGRQPGDPAVTRLRAASSVSRPCWSRNRRSVLLASERSWVTTRMVVLWSRLSELRS